MRIIKILVALLILTIMTACDSKDIFRYQLVINGVHKINKELTLDSIETGVIRINHMFPWGSNSLILEMRNSDIVLVDTPYTYQATKDVVEWIRSIVGQERTIKAINTGFHFDNLGGNKYLHEQGIAIYGTVRTVSLIEEKGEDARSLFRKWLKAPIYKKYYDAFEEVEYVEPTVVFQLDVNQEMVLNFGLEKLILYYPGESHSPDNIVVYYPGKEVLFGGCMVKELKSKDLGNTADANLSEWATSIKRLLNKYDHSNTKIVIPGHGNVGDIQLLERTLELLK